MFPCTCAKMSVGLTDIAGVCKLHMISTRVREHLETDRASHIFKNLESSKACRSTCSLDNFAIVDQASSQFALKIKEALHILWKKTNTLCAGQTREFKVIYYWLSRTWLSRGSNFNSFSSHTLSIGFSSTRHVKLPSSLSK